MILTNELPRFSDSSGALASRFVVSTLRVSFLGREDPNLTDELVEEAPSIINWALEGLDRLRHRGYFVVPASAREAVRDLEDLASPIGAFLRDLCVVDPAYEVGKDALWEAWKVWCVEEGRSRPGTKAVFARDLHAAVPGLRSVRPRAGEQRWHLWRGLKLREQSGAPLTSPDRGEPAEFGQGGHGWSGVSPTVGPDLGEDVSDEDIERWRARVNEEDE